MVDSIKKKRQLYDQHCFPVLWWYANFQTPLDKSQNEQVSKLTVPLKSLTECSRRSGKLESAEGVNTETHKYDHFAKREPSVLF